MYSWFGDAWPSLKSKALTYVDSEASPFDDPAIYKDIEWIEKLCTECLYWDAWKHVLDGLKSRSGSARHVFDDTTRI
ncbi:hypothetical protein BC938DRAFT_480080 [Jimgerdemannia flammicorona]|uniref:Uncharacterized protein n=1 Tax=Jimgerdemannia flammicorona TaxID=994334 RepID=A0A433QJG1_9FUNG|nr:hypothetical protein BC938DRAFT_480080 [Jimgerdemannia flammicorona]